MWYDKNAPATASSENSTYNISGIPASSLTSLLPIYHDRCASLEIGRPSNRISIIVGWIIRRNRLGGNWCCSCRSKALGFYRHSRCRSRFYSQFRRGILAFRFWCFSSSLAIILCLTILLRLTIRRHPTFAMFYLNALF